MRQLEIGRPDHAVFCDEHHGNSSTNLSDTPPYDTPGCDIANDIIDTSKADEKQPSDDINVMVEEVVDNGDSIWQHLVKPMHLQINMIQSISWILDLDTSSRCQHRTTWPITPTNTLY